MNNHDVEYAGALKRVLAWIIDVIILAIPTIIGEAAGPGGGALIALLYCSFMESSKKQATFGKSIMGIKVITKNGEKLSFFRAMWRYISRIFSALILFIGYIMIPFTKKKQGLHDFMAGTLVIKG
jgi:uncharacterized RDD family membrane protein YckC